MRAPSQEGSLEHLFENPSLTVALALFVGVVAQGVARHLAVPGIVVLLAAGVALGPDGLGVVHPEQLGAALEALVGFAVAVILFEGGLALDLNGLWRRQRVLQRLVTWGAAVSAIGGTIAALAFLDWDLRRAMLFGTLVIVTGPTVVTPLLRRWRVNPPVSDVLEAEGVLIDPIGAIIAAVALEWALQPTGLGILVGVGDIALRLGFGGLMGVGFGLALAWTLRHQRVIPTGLENLLALGAVMTLYQLSNAVVHESGIAAVTLAGIATGRGERAPVLEELAGFKEQLTTLFIGMLFVLLAADVRLSEVVGLGWGALATVAFLILVVRPINVAVSTIGSGLGWRERVFMGWIAPRGIVAAAVASLFSNQLAAAGVPGAADLRALTFLVIAITVAVSGLTGAGLATALGLRGAPDRGWIVLGAGSLARLLARSLMEGGEDVVVVDSNPRAIDRAEEDGLRAIRGNGLDERVLHRAGVGHRRNIVAATRNPEVNALFIHTAAEHGRVDAAAAARLTAEALPGEPSLLFGTAVEVERWSELLDSGAAFVERWRLEPERPDPRPLTPGDCDGAMLLPVARVRGGRTTPVVDETRFLPGDEVVFVLAGAVADLGRAELSRHGWVLDEARDLPTGEASRAEVEAVR